MIYSIVKNSFSGNLDFDVLSIELKLDVFLYPKETAIKAVCPFLLSQILYLTLLNQSLPLGILHLEYLHLYVLIGLIQNIGQKYIDNFINLMYIRREYRYK